MKALLETLAELPKTPNGRPKLMTHVVLGYPTLRESIEIVRTMSDCGVSIIELQIPFSDPIADGTTIMRANEASLARGTDTADCLRALEKLSSKTDVPLIVMSYFNPAFNYRGGGLRAFCRDTASAGAQGLIVPDVPVDANREGYWQISREENLLPVPLVSPVTPPSRLKKIAAHSGKGFVYCVSTTGTTGARSKLPKELPDYLKRVSRHFKIPRAVGFGISTPSQVKSLGGLAHIAIVGSATIDLIDNTPKKSRGPRLSQFIRSLIGSR